MSDIIELVTRDTRSHFEQGPNNAGNSTAAGSEVQVTISVTIFGNNTGVSP